MMCCRSDRNTLPNEVLQEDHEKLYKEYVRGYNAATKDCEKVIKCFKFTKDETGKMRFVNTCK